MNQVFKIDELLASITEIRDLKKGFLTNFYLDVSKHTLWINKSVMNIEKIKDTLFIIKKNKSFWNVFFCSTTLEELADDLILFNKKYQGILLIYDIVGNDKILSSYKNIFDKEMNEYSSLVRMYRINAEQNFNLSSDVKIATKDKASELLEIMNSYFDERTEQIPYLEEFISLIELKNILIYEKESKIIGFAIFEKTVSTLYLRYWFVHPDYRDLKVGSKLLNHFFYSGRQCKRHQLWVIKSNHNAIVRYEHYGFKVENLYDVVYTNKQIKYQ